MIQKFGTIEEIIARFDELDEKYRKKLDGQADAMRRWKYLATIVRTVPLEYDFLPFILDDNEYESAVAFLDGYEMRSHVKRAPLVFGPYRSGAAAVEAQAKAQVLDELIEVKLTKASKLEELTAFVGEQAYAAYFPASAAPTNLFDDPDRVAYIAVGSNVCEVSGPLAAALVKKDPAKAIMHDAKPLYRRSFGMERIAAPGFDSMLAGFVLQSTRSNHALRDLVSGYLDVQAPTTSEQLAVAIGRLAPVMRERIALESQTRVLDEIELPLIPVLARMETLGVKANRDGLREFSKTLSVTIEETQRSIYSLAEVEFNISSPKQLGELLFDKMALPGAVKTKTGYATGVEVLGLLAAEYEIVQLILNYRELTKLKSTYADALERLIQEDGRIHTTYNQTGAATGRLSSNDPNLQNIPIRTELGRGIRRAFVADSGYELASLDYSQIELRVLADMCREPALVQAFETGEDVHTVTAKRIFNLGDEAPTKAQRGQAKMLNYAVLYGVTEYGLAQQLGAGFSIAEAKELIKSYHERFPSVTDFTKGIIDEAKSKGFTTTAMGRRRYFPDIHAAKINDRRYAERQAMNAPLQGTAADMLKLAMLSVDKLLTGSTTRMLLNVHDELVFEMPPADEPVLKQIAKAMDSALPLTVPVEVDAKVGSDWDAMRAVKI
jgi:DNA polymerase-1